MSKIFNKIFLDDKAFIFINENLKKFEDLGSNIASHLSLSKSKVYGYYSQNISNEEIYDFDSGGIFKSRPLDEVQTIVNNFLKKNKGSSWILIDNNGNTKYSPEENSINNITTAFFYKNYVLQYFSKYPYINNDLEETFKFGGAYPFIGFTSQISPDIIERIRSNSINKTSIDNIIEKIDLLIIGAYDEEGYLIVELGK